MIEHAFQLGNFISEEFAEDNEIDLIRALRDYLTWKLVGTGVRWYATAD